jgi:hypothetical protein
MTFITFTTAEEAERTLARAILLIAHTRAHIARRGRANTTPLTVALDDVGHALAAAGGEVAPRLMPRVTALTESLAFLVAEMSGRPSRQAQPNAADEMAPPLPAVA